MIEKNFVGSQKIKYAKKLRKKKRCSEWDSANKNWRKK